MPDSAFPFVILISVFLIFVINVFGWLFIKARKEEKKRKN